MEHQNWETVIINNKKHSKPLVDKHKISYAQKLIRSIESSETVPEVKIKRLSHESKQLIIQKRIELGYDQTKLNTMCSLPSGTIKDIESGKLHPTPKQLSILNNVLKISLKYES
jgi:ribosome-binding protein aMBF1 (putative translation factor)